MESQELHFCRLMKYYLRRGFAVKFLRKFREYGIDLRDSSIIQISHCPWCGAKLPTSLRDEWFERIDALGIDPDWDPIPTRMKSEKWYSDPERSVRKAVPRARKRKPEPKIAPIRSRKPASKQTRAKTKVLRRVSTWKR